MVWFQCEDCGETLKKPKLAKHIWQCSATRFSCIDCMLVFDRQGAMAHTSCVTEKEKYQLGATKPDGFVGNKNNYGGGNHRDASGKIIQGKQGKGNRDEGVDMFLGLSQSAPWRCSLCRVDCTSWETLEGHAAGKRHMAKCRTAAKAKANGGEGEGEGEGEENGGRQLQENEKKKEEDVVVEEETLRQDEGMNGDHDIVMNTVEKDKVVVKEKPSIEKIENSTKKRRKNDVQHHDEEEATTKRKSKKQRIVEKAIEARSEKRIKRKENDLKEAKIKRLQMKNKIKGKSNSSNMNGIGNEIDDDKEKQKQKKKMGSWASRKRGIKIRWKSLAIEELSKSNDGHMSLQGLVSRLIRASQTDETDSSRLEAIMCILKSNKLVAQGGIIRLK